MAKLARILKNYNLFVDGFGKAGVVTSVSPPVLTTKMEEFRAGGMDLPAEIDMGMEKLEFGFVLGEYDPTTTRLYGLADGKATQLTLRSAMRRDGEPAVPEVYNLTGVIKVFDPGDRKVGDASEATFNVALRYYKYTVDGTVLHEIDVDNMKRVINGVDQLETIRAAIGV